MEPLAIVPNLHVLNERGACNRSGRELCIGTLGRDCAEKALHNGIIVAISNAAHADFTPLIRQLLLISSTGVLAALIGVVQQPSWWMSSGQGHLKVSFHQRRSHVIRHRPADHHPRIQIQHRGQV
jgi:hypothetical protein